MAANKPHKTNDTDSWDDVRKIPEPQLEHASFAEMFAYLLEVAGHRAIDPNATNEWGSAAGPNPYCGVASEGRQTGTNRAGCASCVALRLYRHGKVLS